MRNEALPDVAQNSASRNSANRQKAGTETPAWVSAVSATGLACLQAVAFTTNRSVLQARLLPGLAIPLAFALAARRLRGVTWNGAAAGFLCAFMIFSCGGRRAFIALMAVFILTLAATRYRYLHKHSTGIAEKPGGRSSSQVLANLAVAAGCFALATIFHRNLLTVAAIAALCEAAADTISSEIGQAVEKNTYLITTFRRIQPGMNGGISVQGSLAGLLASLVVASTYFSWGGATLTPEVGLIIVLAGWAGMLFDSFLGALFERPGWLNNDAVNLCGTTGAALIAAYGCHLLAPGATISALFE